MIDPRRPNHASTPFGPDRPRFGYAPVPADRADDFSRPPHAPAVTVVTPYFNTGPLLHETAACVLGGSLQDFEWVIVNDCSTDPSALAVLDEYRPGGARNPRGDPRIRVIDHPSNHGLSAARNTGFRAARSRQVFQLDSDDLIEPTTLEKCAIFLDLNPAFAFVKGNTVGFAGQRYLWEKGFHDGAGFLDQNLVTATAMIRRSVHSAVGGFDETIRGGMEDWEFWLRAAAHAEGGEVPGTGHWGATIPEFLDWYRRRPAQQFDAWDNLRCEQAAQRFKERMHREHGRLFEPGGFPSPARAWHMPCQALGDGPRFANRLDKPAGMKRLLMIVPWLRMGGADRFNLDLLRFLTGEGWEVTVAATLSTGVSPATGNGHPWLADFARYTPDIFILPHLGSPPDYPALLRHLIDSRRPDFVLTTNSEHGYACLPYLRSACPRPAYLDFNHMEETGWKNGGHPRAGAGMQAQLDLNITVSHHLKRWMCAPPRRAFADRVEVCHINADTERWKPDPRRRRAVRRALGIDEDAVVILYAARLCAQKQPLVFVETIRKLRGLLGGGAGERGFVALVAGDGELQGPFEAALDAHGLRGELDGDGHRRGGCVRTLGAVKTDRMPAIMAAADIFFLPSEWEGIALSIYEAMSAGLAVVGAEVGGQAELVVPGTGVLIKRPEGDAELEAEQYARVLAELVGSVEARKALGTAARRRIQGHFELKNMGARMLALLALAEEHRTLRPRPPLAPHFARELAVMGIESLRAQELADYLWRYRTEHFEREARRELERRERREAAERAVAYIEGSSAWRLVQRCKRLPVYRAYARARWGPGWEAALGPGVVEVVVRSTPITVAPAPPAAAPTPAPARPEPEDRLARLRGSRSYRAMMALKRLPPVVVVSRLRHGKDHRAEIPELLRND